MGLDAVAVFVEVVRARSFTAAAKALGLPRSTVSLRVTELEARLGVTLLHRTTRRVQPTPAGEAYFASAARSLADLQAAGVEASQAQTEPSGVLRVTSSSDGVGHVNDRITEFLALHPRISVDLWLTDRKIDLLSEGVDVAFRIGTLGDDPTLIAHRIDTAHLGLYASPAYLRQHPAPSHPRDLPGHDLMMFTRRASFSMTREREKLEIEAAPRFVANSAVALRHQARHGAGIALLPAVLVEDDLRPGSLVRVLDGWIGGTVPIHLVYTRQRYLPHRVRLFIELVLARARQRSAKKRRPRE